MPTPFPSQFVLTRSSKPRILSRSRQRFLSDGSIAKNQFTIDVTLFAEPDPDAEAAEADESEEA